MERQRISKEFHPSSITFQPLSLAISFSFTIHQGLLFIFRSIEKNFRRHVFKFHFFHSNESDRFFSIASTIIIASLFSLFFFYPKITKLFLEYLFPRPSPRSLKGTRLSRDSVGSSCGRRMVRCASPSLPSASLPVPSCQGNPPATPVHYGVGWVS